VYAYDYVKPIAEGSFGTVFLATDKRSKRLAIKKLKLSPKMKEQKIYEREIDLLLDCKHDNVVYLKELATNSKGDLFLVFDYLDYDLKQLLVNCSEQLMQESVLKHLLRQLLSGLDYLHSKHIIHRDLKPRNLLVDVTGKLEIADLGSARYWLRGAFLSPDVVTLRYR
jgi:serine/threonine protein kinase